jgi:protein O-GlcNAc transferase
MTSGTTELAGLLDVAVDYHRSGRLAEAERVYRDILARYPGFPEVYYNLGLALHGLGRLEDAEAALRAALDARPLYAEALTALGNLQQARDRPEAAVVLYRQALEIRPDAAEIHNNLGNALKSLNRLEEALGHLDEATRLKPGFADAFYNYGNALTALGRAGEAVARYRRALAIKPLYPAALNNLGSALKEQGRLKEAAASYRQALAIAPDFVDPQHNLLFSLIYREDLDPAEIYREHREWAMARVDFLAAAAPAFTMSRDPERRLRVGYVSPDFHEHPVATFLEPLLAAHHGDRIESFCYVDSLQEDARSARLKSHAGHWRMIRGLSSAAAAELVRQDGIDILVDLAGHTARNRLALFACRAAPVQISWLGYPCTTGMAALDYRLTDAIADPPGAEDLHSETLLRLPRGFLCYGPPADAPDPGSLPALERGAVTFGSFNNFSKLSPATVRLWSALLKAVPAASLVLKAKQASDEETVDRLRQDFAAGGVGRDRLRFLTVRASHADHLATYQRIDIALDPFPYNGTTTSCEALWMGVPMVTLRGHAHAGRVGASLLARLELDDLVAEDEAGYLAIARDLAADRPRLSTLRAALRGRMRQDLCDGERFAGEVEAAYRAAWRGWCAGHSIES